jgi:hypothetical protein
MRRVGRIEDRVEGFVGQRFYPPKFITLGLSSVVRVKER